MTEQPYDGFQFRAIGWFECLRLPPWARGGFLGLGLRLSLGRVDGKERTEQRHRLCDGFADMNGSVGFRTFVLASISASAWSLGDGLFDAERQNATKQHQNLVILVWMVYGMIIAYRTLDIVWMYHIVGSVMKSELSIILDIIGHVVYLLDPNEFEMSVGSYRVLRIAESVVNVLEISVSLFFIGHLLMKSKLTIFHMHQLIDNANGFHNQHGLFHATMKRRYMIGHLPMASGSDLGRYDMRVICHLEMHIGSWRKLPCSHCFHAGCIERWICQQIRCPICQRDLKPLKDEAERMLNGETDPRPVSVEHQKIIRFADLVQ
jgi:hypothetical protein